MAQTNHCLSTCGEPSHCYFGSLQLLDIQTPHCAVLKIQSLKHYHTTIHVPIVKGDREVRFIDGDGYTQ